MINIKKFKQKNRLKDEDAVHIRSTEKYYFVKLLLQ